MNGYGRITDESILDSTNEQLLQNSISVTVSKNDSHDSIMVQM